MYTKDSETTVARETANLFFVSSAGSPSSCAFEFASLGADVGPGVAAGQARGTAHVAEPNAGPAFA